MSFIYPASPVVGQDYTINGKSLRYNGIGFIPSPHTSDQAPDVLTEILPTDYIGGRRSVTGAEWTFETLRDNIFASGGASTVFVSTADEFVSAIAMEHSIIEICVTKPITVNPFNNVYADNVYLTGCEITLPDGFILCNKTSTNITTNYLINNALLYDVTDPDESVIVVTALVGMARTWNITVREFKTTRRLGVLVPAGCELNLITGKPLILDAQQLVGSYTATVDATLDLGQEDIRLDGSNIPDAPQHPSGTKLLMQNPAGVELVPISTIGAAVTAGYVRKDGTNISSVYGALNLNSLVLFKEIGESIGTATVSDLKTAFNLPDTGFLYNTVVTNANETIHFTCTNGGNFAVRCRYGCNESLNRTIDLIPAIPIKISIDKLTCVLISKSAPDEYTAGTDTFNKFINDSTPLSFTSSINDSDDLLEYRNSNASGTVAYTISDGMVDLSVSGLTLALVYSGSLTVATKEVVLIGSFIQK